VKVSAKDLFPGDRITLRFTADTIDTFREHDFVSVGNAEHNLNLNVDPDTRLPVRRGVLGWLFWALNHLNGHR
jgi:hypothetical protein